MVATGRGAELGVLIKGGEPLERSEALDTVVFDKTGTLTEGRPAVQAVERVADGPVEDEREVLALAAAVERLSEHPLAEAIVAEAARRGLTERTVSGFESRTGLGVVGAVEGRRVAVGNLALMRELGIDTNPLAARAEAAASAGRTPMYVAVETHPAGLIAVADPIKPSSAEAVARLGRLGLEAVMLTGDNPRTAESVARSVGIARVLAEVPPDRKLDEIRRLQEEGRVVAIVVRADGTLIRPLGLPTPLRFGPDWENSGPAWSPDGTLLAYNRVEPLDGELVGHFRIHVIRADGTGDIALPGPVDPARARSS
jgi:Cu+-exporting ATPase